MKTQLSSRTKSRSYIMIALLTVASLLWFSALRAQTYTQSQVLYSWDTPATNIATSSCDDCVYGLPLPFNFQFFGNNYTSCFVSTNGLMTFGTSSAALNNVCIPNTSVPNNFVTGFWDDLYFDYSCSATGFRYGTFGVAPNRRFVVSWIGFRRYGGSCGALVYTQIKLFETSNNIEVHLQSNTTGYSGTIGIENVTGTAGYQWICNTATTDGTARRFAPVPPCVPPTSISTTVTPAVGCYTNQSVVFNVSGQSGGSAGLGVWEYQWQDGGTVLQAWSASSSYTTMLSSSATYTVYMRSTGCPAQMSAGFDAAHTHYIASTVLPSQLSPANTSVVSSSTCHLTWNGSMGTHPASRYDVFFNGGPWTSVGTATSFSANLNVGYNSWAVRYYDGCSGTYYVSPTWSVYYSPASYCGVIDHFGADWTISTNQVVAGDHINVGTFTVNIGITATVDPFCHYFNVNANTVNLEGTIDADGAGYGGGAGGIGGSYADGNDTYCFGGGGGASGMTGDGPGGGSAGNDGTDGNCSMSNCGFLCSGSSDGFHDGGGGAGGGGGGSYGGSGGYGAFGANGVQVVGGGSNYGSGGNYGPVVGNASDQIIAWGSGGGGAGGGGGSWAAGTNGGIGGSGGGAVTLAANNTLFISGAILANGTSGGAGGNGGGRSSDNAYNCTSQPYGGCVMPCGYVYDAPGGAGGGGGAGSGGGIKLESRGLANITGILSAAGGKGGAAGQPDPIMGGCFDYARGGAGGGGGRVKIITNPCMANIVNPVVDVDGGNGGNGYSTGADGLTGSYVNNLVLTGYSVLSSNISGGISTVCHNENPGTLTANAAGGTGNYNYVWYKNGSSTGVTTQTYNPGNLTSGASFYCKVSSGTCGPVTTNTISVSLENTAPQITCPANITIDNDPGVCGALVNYNVNYTDNCPDAMITQTSGYTSGSAFSIGTTVNTFKVIDGNNNSATCSFTVTVNDTEYPHINCPGYIVVNNDPGECGAIVTFDVTYSDNCQGSIYEQTTGLPSGSYFPGGTTTNSVRVIDQAHNLTFCVFNVTVKDEEPPALSCGSSYNRDADIGTCSYMAVGNEFDPGSMSDNCTGVTLVNNLNNASTLAGWIFPTGPTTVTWTATDANYNVTQCNTTINVSDPILPTIVCPADQVRNITAGSCDYTVVAVEFNPSAADNCPGVSVINDFNGASTLAGAGFPAGVTIVTWTVADLAGNTQACSFEVLVIDTEAPQLTHCPGTLLYATDPGVCQHTITGADMADPEFLDNCNNAVMQNTYNGLSTLVGAVFTEGAHNVVWTIGDPAGNMVSCSYTLFVKDEEAPAMTCGGDITVNMESGLCTYTASGTVLDPSVSDNCSSSFLYNDYNALATLNGTTFNGGSTLITWVATDAAYNVSTCSYNVIVIDDQEPEVICPTDQVRPTDPGLCTYVAVGTEFNPVINDNCNNLMAQNDYNALNTLESAVFSAGTTTIIWTVSDGSGSSQICTFTVTVEENEPPTITCPADQVRPTSATMCQYIVQGNEFQPAFYDNCGGAAIQNSYNVLGSLDGAVFMTGSSAVTWTVVDASGNSASCDFNITVNDEEAPQLTCPPNMVLCFEDNTYQVINEPYFATDNCGLLSVITDQPPVFPVGQNLVTFTAMDVNGNSSACSMVVNQSGELLANIVQGNLPAYCQGAAVTLTAVIPGSSGVAYLWSTGQTTPEIEVYAPGVYGVTVTDINGCQASGSLNAAFDCTCLISSYIMLVSKDIELEGCQVYDLGVGSKGVAGKLKAKGQTQITAPGTFVKAAVVEVDNSSIVSDISLGPVTTPWLPYNFVPHHGGLVISVPNNSTVYLDDTLYKEIKVGKFATAIFTQPVVNVERKLKLEEGATIRFNTCAVVRVKDRFEAGKNATVNPDDVSVVFYVDNDVIFGEGCHVTGGFHLGEYTSSDTVKHKVEIAASKVNRPGIYKVMIFAENVKAGRNNLFYQLPHCHFCNPAIPKNLATAEPAIIISGDAMVTSHPNPFNETTSVIFTLPQDDHVSIDVFDVAGNLLERIFDEDVSEGAEYRAEFTGSLLPAGIYIYKMTTSENTFTGKMMLVR